MSLATIIITNYNKAPFLKESIDSALNQNFEDFDVLITDDGSTDESMNIINEYQNNPKTSIIFKENEGVITTRNRAINEAKGKYIVQLDGDDKLDVDFLKLTVPVLEKKEKVGIAYCLTEFIGAKSGLWNLGEYSIEKELITNQIVITALFRKDDYLKTEGYSNDFQKGYEDWDFWLSIIELGKEVRQINQVGFYYRILSNSRNRSFNTEIEKELKSKIYQRHIKLYLKYGFDGTNLLWEIEKLKNQNKSLSYYKNSIDYKIGSILLAIPRKIKSLLK